MPRSVVLWGGIIGGLLILTIVDLLPSNLWSVQYLKHELRDGRVNSLAPPPSDHIRGRVWLALEAAKKGDPENALADLRQLARHREVWTHFQLASLLVREGSIDEAIATWNSARAGAEVFLSAGEWTLRAGRTADAEKLFRAAYQSSPEMAVLPLGHFLWQRRANADEAIDLLGRAIRKHPNSAWKGSWLRLRGDIFRQQGKWAQAATAYTRALSSDPEKAQAQLGLAWLQFERDRDIKAAMSLMQEALEAEPERARTFVEGARLLSEAGKWSQAEIWFERALLLEPENYAWWIQRANAARGGGNNRLALEIYREMIHRFPQNADAYYEAAWMQRRLDQNPEQSLQWIQTGLELIEAPEAHHLVRAGRLYEWANQPDRARSFFLQALTLDSNHPEAVEGLQRLEERQSPSPARGGAF